MRWRGGNKLRLQPRSVVEFETKVRFEGGPDGYGILSGHGPEGYLRSRLMWYDGFGTGTGVAGPHAIDFKCRSALNLLDQMTVKLARRASQSNWF